MNRLEILVKNESELASAAKSLINFAGEVKVWIFKGEMGADNLYPVHLSGTRSS